MDFYIQTQTVCKLCDFIPKLSPFLRKPCQGYAPSTMIFFLGLKNPTAVEVMEYIMKVQSSQKCSYQF